MVHFAKVNDNLYFDSTIFDFLVNIYARKQ